MKKTIILLVLSSIVHLSGYAQQKYEKELYVGASAGMNFASVSFAPRVNTKMLQAYTGGLLVRWNTENFLGLQAEINYSQHGWNERFDDTKYNYSRTINYVELPFFTHIYFGSNKVRGFVNLGPKISYALSESTDSNLGDEKPNNINVQHDMPIENKLGWGLCGGPGLEIHTGIGVFSLEGRYYYSLGDIYKSKKIDPFATSAHQVMTVKLAYMIRLK